MKALVNKTHRLLRGYNKATLLEHCESRMATLSKRSIKEQNIRNEANDIEMKIDFSRLNQETLAYLAFVLNNSQRK